MAGKWPQNHQKTFFNIYMMFGQHFKHFFKNRKKSIFEKFFSDLHQQNWPNFDFSAGNRPKKFRIRKNIPKPLSKNFLPTYSDLGRFLPLFLFWGAIFTIFHTFTLRPFWPQKIIYIYIKFYFFQNLQNLSFLSIYTLLGKFSARKKI